ncbi:hypothetical protein [Lentilactobacillus hilgardii]|uniref:hypothetical protein n=1 Tax=Lentilactobacillus hilgardii TaxID=1588 RepID=UPI003FA527D1
MNKFSKNDQVIFWSAEEDLDDQKFHQVLNKTEHLEAKYPDDLRIHLLMAQALFALHESADAYRIIFDYREQLFEVPKYLPAVFHIVLENNGFMFAREFLPNVSSTQRLKWLAKIENAEEKYREKDRNDLNNKMKNLAHLGSLDAYKQVHGINDALKMPLKEYLTAAKLLLSDPFGWQVSKTQVLLELNAVGSGETIDLTWIDKNSYHLPLNELKPLTAYHVLIDALREIDKKYGADDPIKFQLLEKELFTQSSYIYPFFDKVIQDSKFWVKIIVADLFGDHLEVNTPAQREMLGWIKQIHQAESFIKFV